MSLIVVNPASLTVSTMAGTDASPAQIAVYGYGGIAPSASSNVSWLTVSPASFVSIGGQNVVVITATFGNAAAGLASGTHLAQITLTDATASNSPVVVPVTLLVTAVPIPPVVELRPAKVYVATRLQPVPGARSIYGAYER